MTDWSSLSASEQDAVLASPALTVTSGAELLDSDLSVVEDISDDLDASGGDVAWDGDATVHRGCTVTLARELDWGTDLIRLYQVLTDGVSGVSARAELGVFSLSAPDEPLGVDPVAYQLDGQDRLSLLNRQVGYSYSVAAGTNVLAALAQVFTDAGLTGVRIDSSASAATVPADRVWPLLPTTSTDSPDADGPVTWLRIVNDLAELVHYRGVWADGDGYYRLGPYADPTDRPPSRTFDSTTASTVVGARTVTKSVAKVNKWIFVNSSLPDVTNTAGDLVPATPTAGAGLYVVTNQSDGPSSVDALGLTWPVQVTYQAADQTALESLGDARVASDKRAVVTAQVETVPYPPASHFDVFRWVDDALDGGEWKVQATSWRTPLDGGNTQWVWQQV